MVFYNKPLKSYVIIELKTTKLMPEAVGQLNMYLNYYENEVNDEGDNKPIGIILCTDKDSLTAEYALGGLSSNIFASMNDRDRKLDAIKSESGILIYRTEEGVKKIEVIFEGESVWLSKNQMAELFQRDRSVISKHIRNVFNENELSPRGNVQNLHIAYSNKPVDLNNYDIHVERNTL